MFSFGFGHPSLWKWEIDDKYFLFDTTLSRNGKNPLS